MNIKLPNNQNVVIIRDDGYSRYRIIDASRKPIIFIGITYSSFNELYQIYYSTLKYTGT